MAENNLDSTLSFSEFPPVSTDEWEARIEKDLKGANYKEKLKWDSIEGLSALPFYRSEDISKYRNALFNKGNWQARQRITDPDASDANRRALQALQNGASGLYFDGPSSQIHSRHQLEDLLKDIQPDIIGIQFGPAHLPARIIPWIEDILSEKSLNNKNLDIAFTMDPFTQAMKSGQLPNRENLGMAYPSDEVPFKVLAVNAIALGNAGATIIQQLAFSLAAANELLGLESAPGSLSAKAKNFTFNFSTGPSYFLEIAKYRALRVLWKNLLNKYESGLGEEIPAFIHAEDSRVNKTVQDAHNNMLRSTSEAMAAALGGADAITIGAYDEPFENPSDFSSRMARNTQLMLKEEAYLSRVADPGAGSYYIESLTDKMAAESWKLFQEIEQRGGYYECIKNNFIQSEITASRLKKIQSYKNTEAVLVGINKYPPEELKQAVSPDEYESVFPFQEVSSVKVERIRPLNIEFELQHEEQA